MAVYKARTKPAPGYRPAEITFEAGSDKKAMEIAKKHAQKPIIGLYNLDDDCRCRLNLWGVGK